MRRRAFCLAYLVFLLPYTHGAYQSICRPATYVGPNGCEWCTPAKYTDTHSTATSCLPCPAGSYSEFRATICFCKAGRSGPGNANCPACVAGTYKSATGSAPCNECVLGKTSAIGSTAVGACVCKAGYGTSACTRCPANTYKPSLGTSACLVCLGDKYVSDDSTQCLSCAVNFVFSTVLKVCSCRPGYGGEECVKCGAGFYRTELRTSECIKCPPDKYITDDAIDCLTCPLGMKATTDQTGCVPFQTNFIINVTDDYRNIFKSNNTTASSLLTAATARQRVNATLMYDAATGEENLWQHITNHTTRSCQDLIAVIAVIPDIKDQYIQAVRLLKRGGPCAPGFTGYDLLQDPGNAEFADSECVLLATTAEDTRRDALMVVQRRYMGRDATDQYEIYDYSAQYLTPALVRHVFGSKVRDGEQVSFCNVRDRLHSPAAFETALSRVGLWTLPQDVAVVDMEGLVETAQIRQSVACP